MIKPIMSVLVALLLAGTVNADVPSKAVIDAISKRLSKPEMALDVTSVKHSPIPAIYEVGFSNGLVVFATETGENFITGDMFSAKGGELTNLSELRREKKRSEVLATVPVEELIVFPAKGEKKASVTIFTDVTCYYCRELHKEVPLLNSKGVEVRYLAWPRGGMGSDGFRLLATAWCAEDGPAVLTKLKNSEDIKENVCAGNPVQQQFDLGREMGVNATPTIILDSGKMIPGYQPADKLLKQLGV